MKNKDITPILKNCIGVQLYDRVRDDFMQVQKVTDDKIICTSIDGMNTIFEYMKNGAMCEFPNGIVALQPSMQIEDFDVLEWKPGDILISSEGDGSYNICIFGRFTNNEYTSFVSIYTIYVTNDNCEMAHNVIVSTQYYSKCKDMTKARSTFDKGVKIICGVPFDFDKIRPKWEDREFQIGHCLKVFYDDKESLCFFNGFGKDGKNDLYLKMKSVYKIENKDFIKAAVLSVDRIQGMSYATEQESALLADIIQKQHSSKNDNTKEDSQFSAFKPFEKVLARDHDNKPWIPEFYMRYVKNDEHPHHCYRNIYKHCIPYKGNESLAFKV